MTSGISTTINALDALLADVADLPTWSLPSDELHADLRAIARAKARLAELELRLAHQSVLNGDPDTKGRWANQTRQVRRDVHRRLAVAAALDQRDVLREAMSRGEVAEDQATVIVRALEELPTDIEPSIVDLAEKELVRLAEHHDAADLAQAGKRILDVVAPEVGDEQLRRALEREEETTAQTCRLTMTDDGHGRCHGRFTTSTRHGAMLRKILLALNSPRRPHHRTLKPGPERMGRAFTELIERYPTDRLPDAGGVSSSVVVTMTLAALTGSSDQPALLDTGHHITAGEARRLACEAGIIPMVLDGASKPLDVGRQKRFHTPAQRLAVAQRDKTCTADGCDYPPSLCHVHHDISWSAGGTTNVETGRLLCPKHHRVAHSAKYTMKHLTNGRVVFGRC